jgi:hypothetical protein
LHAAQSSAGRLLLADQQILLEWAVNRTAPNRIAGIALSTAGAAVIAWFTLRSGPLTQPPIQIECCSATDLVLNILLFVPFGAGLALLGLRPWMAGALGALISVAVELSQLWWVAGRYASVPDALTNWAGTLLGAMVVATWAKRSRWWPIAAPGTAVLVVLWWLAVAFLVRPAIPTSPEWLAQWAHESAGTVPFRGQLVALALQDRPLPNGSIVPRAEVHATLSHAGAIRLTATAVTGPAPHGRARLAGIVTGPSARDYMSIWQDGPALLAYQRLNLNVAGQQGAWLRLENAVPVTAGDTVRIALTTSFDRLGLVAAAGGVERESSLRLTPELFMGALLPGNSREIDGFSWWSFIPALASFAVLGFALATRPALLLAAGLGSIFLGPLLMGSTHASWLVAVVAFLGAWEGRRLAHRLEMFGDGKPGLPTPAG